MAKSGSRTGNYRHAGQAVTARQLLQCTARARRDTRLTEPRAAGAWWPMGACLQQFSKLFNISPSPSQKRIIYQAMHILMRRSTSITSPVFTEDRGSMLFAPYTNRMRIDFNVSGKVVSMPPAHRRG
jgi:hypothetical protein